MVVLIDNVDPPHLTLSLTELESSLAWQPVAVPMREISIVSFSTKQGFILAAQSSMARPRHEVSFGRSYKVS